ncbi:MAG: hypothetical protein HFACDABA_02218 [Anaerolineales bacterium]|nr:hypothetical protein [Anaerolineales bacterium]
MNTSPTKPSLVTAISIMTLVNGIFNIIFGIALAFGTFLLCSPLALLVIVLGGFEIAYAMKLLGDPPQAVQPSQSIAIWEIVAVAAGNVFSAVVGILVLVFYNDATVKEYFARLNNPPTPPPAPPAPAAPLPVESTPVPVAPPADETPAWLKPEDSDSMQAPASPVEGEAQPVKKKSPAKPKTVRKPASKK